jgi:hypothetical protein
MMFLSTQTWPPPGQSTWLSKRVLRERAKRSPQTRRTTSPEAVRPERCSKPNASSAFSSLAMNRITGSVALVLCSSIQPLPGTAMVSNLSTAKVSPSTMHLHEPSSGEISRLAVCLSASVFSPGAQHLHEKSHGLVDRGPRRSGWCTPPAGLRRGCRPTHDCARGIRAWPRSGRHTSATNRHHHGDGPQNAASCRPAPYMRAE